MEEYKEKGNLRTHLKMIFPGPYRTRAPDCWLSGCREGKGPPNSGCRTSLHPHRAQNPTCMSAQPLVPKSTAPVPPHFPQSFLVSRAGVGGSLRPPWRLIQNPFPALACPVVRGTVPFGSQLTGGSAGYTGLLPMPSCPHWVEAPFSC